MPQVCHSVLSMAQYGEHSDPREQVPILAEVPADKVAQVAAFLHQIGASNIRVGRHALEAPNEADLTEAPRLQDSALVPSECDAFEQLRGFPQGTRASTWAQLQENSATSHTPFGMVGLKAPDESEALSSAKLHRAIRTAVCRQKLNY